jgi:cytochrome oxidase assembly protein ShyY1
VYRFLLRPRWLALMVAVALLVTIFVQLAQWQLHRLEQRRAANAVVTTNAGAAARPVGEVLAPDRAVTDHTEWTPVRARGHYDVDHEILVRYRPFEGEPGFHVLTPLVLADRTAVLVDRGWIPTSRTNAPPTPPPPTAGEVTVVGRARPSETADPGTGRPEDGQVRMIDVAQIAATLPYPVGRGYVELVSQTPPVAGELPRLLPPPELSEGPHLAYAMQWYLFSVIAVGGLGFLAYDEAHGGRYRNRLRSSAQASATVARVPPRR